MTRKWHLLLVRKQVCKNKNEALIAGKKVLPSNERKGRCCPDTYLVSLCSVCLYVLCETWRQWKREIKRGLSPRRGIHIRGLFICRIKGKRITKGSSYNTHISMHAAVQKRKISLSCSVLIGWQGIHDSEANIHTNTKMVHDSECTQKSSNAARPSGTVN